MAHSVERHLEVRPESYDAAIRRFVPGYDAMQDELCLALAHLVAGRPAPTLVDLGAGTGALSARILERLPQARVILLDADAAMLEQAGARLGAHRDRIQLLHASFADPLPECDAAVASLALHHVHGLGDKRALYSRIHRALRPGGALLSADAMVAEDGPLAQQARRRWAEHLVAHGDTEAGAAERFADWAREDRYHPIADELQALREAGFAWPEVVWRAGPMAVVAALRD